MNNHSFLTALGYDKTCPTSGAEKCNTGIGLACDGGKCACSTSGETYRSEIGRCTDQKLLGETCTGSGTGDCFTTSSKLHCIIYSP